MNDARTNGPNRRSKRRSRGLKPRNPSPSNDLFDEDLELAGETEQAHTPAERPDRLRERRRLRPAGAPAWNPEDSPPTTEGGRRLKVNQAKEERKERELLIQQILAEGEAKKKALEEAKAKEQAEAEEEDDEEEEEERALERAKLERRVRKAKQSLIKLSNLANSEGLAMMTKSELANASRKADKISGTFLKGKCFPLYNEAHELSKKFFEQEVHRAREDAARASVEPGTASKTSGDDACHALSRQRYRNPWLELPGWLRQLVETIPGSSGNHMVVLAELAYWSSPVKKDGQLRARNTHVDVDDNGCPWLVFGPAELAKRTGLRRDQISRALDWLRKYGLLLIRNDPRGRHGPNTRCFRLPWDTMWARARQLDFS
jgi:hypothetical protein